MPLADPAIQLAIDAGVPVLGDIELFARDCFRLMNNEVIVKDGVELSLRGFEEVTKDDQTYTTARIRSKVIDQAEAVGQEESTGVSV